MTSDFESALRSLLKSVIREVIDEALSERVSAGGQPPGRSDDPFLLSSREAAERLAISQGQLYRMTKAGLLPCVRVGRLVRYSAETIQQWIRNTESGEVVVPPARRTKPKPVNANVPKPKKLRQKTAPARHPEKVFQAPAHNSPRQQVAAGRHHEPRTEAEERPNPFSLLLNELGVARSALPPLTNGDLRRIAEVDVPTIHGWLYLGRELPEAALGRLREHFGAYRAD